MINVHNNNHLFILQVNNKDHNVYSHVNTMVCKLIKYNNVPINVNQEFIIIIHYKMKCIVKMKHVNKY